MQCLPAERKSYQLDVRLSRLNLGAIGVLIYKRSSRWQAKVPDSFLGSSGLGQNLELLDAFERSQATQRKRSAQSGAPRKEAPS